MKTRSIWRDQSPIPWICPPGFPPSRTLPGSAAPRAPLFQGAGDLLGGLTVEPVGLAEPGPARHADAVVEVVEAAGGVRVGVDHDRHPARAGLAAVGVVEVEPVRVRVNFD